MHAPLTRRQFVAAAAGVGLAAAFLPRRAPGMVGTPRVAHAGETFFDWPEVAKGVRVAINRTGGDMTLVGGNAVLVDGPDGALLIDTKQTVLGPALRREAGAIAPRIAQVLNTHHHFDHAGGNPSFGPEIPITMHGKCWMRLQEAGRQNLAQLDAKIEALGASELPGAKAAADDARAFKERVPSLGNDAWAVEKRVGRLSGNATMEVAGRRVEIYHAGAGHTDTDLFVFLKSDNVLVASDLVFNGLHPYFDVAGGATSAGWLRSLRAARELCTETTVVVPGHGAVADRGAIDRQIEYFEKAIGAVERAIAAKATREEVLAIELEAYKGYGLAIARPLVLGGIFDERTPKTPAPAPAKPEPATPQPK